MHFLAKLRPYDPLPYRRIYRMRRRVNRHTRPYEHTCADTHSARVQHGEIRTDERVSPDGDVDSVVYPDRTLDPRVAAELGVVFLLGRSLGW